MVWCDKSNTLHSFPVLAEKVSSLGKHWHRFCLKCERCSKILSPGGHAEHDGLPYCHKPCYGTLFGPKETLLCVCRTSLEQENGFMMTQKLCFLMVLISYILLVEIIRIKAGLSG
uniref:Cysteine-rich protein 3 n=1 Tax=Cyprinus carpio TaxID=7962 RepID=A0A8C1A7C9_CYPCA